MAARDVGFLLAAKTFDLVPYVKLYQYERCFHELAFWLWGSRGNRRKKRVMCTRAMELVRSSSSVASSWALDMSVHICQVDVSVDCVYVYPAMTDARLVLMSLSFL
jgi:hypothetical protein